MIRINFSTSWSNTPYENLTGDDRAKWPSDTLHFSHPWFCRLEYPQTQRDAEAAFSAAKRPQKFLPGSHFSNASYHGEPNCIYDFRASLAIFSAAMSRRWKYIPQYIYLRHPAPKSRMIFLSGLPVWNSRLRDAFSRGCLITQSLVTSRVLLHTNRKINRATPSLIHNGRKKGFKRIFLDFSDEGMIVPLPLMKCRVSTIALWRLHC